MDVLGDGLEGGGVAGVNALRWGSCRRAALLSSLREAQASRCGTRAPARRHPLILNHTATNGRRAARKCVGGIRSTPPAQESIRPLCMNGWKKTARSAPPHHFKSHGHEGVKVASWD